MPLLLPVLLISLHEAQNRHIHTHLPVDTPALHSRSCALCSTSSVTSYKRFLAVIQMSARTTSHFCLLVLPVMSLLVLFSPIGWSYDGVTPGCHLHPFNVTIRSDRRGTCKGTHLVYACVGYCESSAFPSRYSVLVASNFTHNITSTSRCCTISKDAKVKVRLDCPRGRHHDELEILTAKACRCDMCRKSRY
ncbi:glycoprotein hormone alpha-2 [Micropterus salmoides]|uniref:glycoprotein hormone alpha-2 n=1 Tax=Micropterus salmoides TaxID=27706 RepID=UPI0018EBB829|nr:glycoprotein hormone alpha-2 [Micropterus salmoides]